MPMQPSPSDVHVDAVLTNISVAFMQAQSDFIATQVFPIVPVAKQTDLYRTYDRSFWMREEAQLRAPGTESAGGGYTQTTASYHADVYAFHKDIDDQTRANADADVDLETDATRYVSRQLLLKLEGRFVGDFLTTGLWTGAATGTDQTGVSGVPIANQFKQWNDPSSTPIEDLSRLIDQMHEKTGYRPNRLVLGAKTEVEIKNHPDILSRIIPSGRYMGSAELLAELIGVDRVVIARGTRNTAAEGVTAAYSYYFSKGAWLGYSAPAPSVMEPSAGYMFAWTGYTGAGEVNGLGTGSRIKRMRMEHLNSDRIEGEMSIGTKVVAPELGIYLASAVA